MTGLYIMHIMFFFVCVCATQMSHTNKKTNFTLCRLLDGAVSTATVVGQVHGGNGDDAEFIHVDDRHHFLGGGLTTCHL